MIINENIIRKALRQAINEMIDEDRIEKDNGAIEIDNFEAIGNLLDFKVPNDTIYFVQIVKRDKDNPRTKIEILCSTISKTILF